MTEFINTIDVIGDDALTDSIIDMSITEYHDDSVTKIGAYAFKGRSKLTSVNIPAVTEIGTSSFSGCSWLTSMDCAVATSIGYSAFGNCYSLTTVILRSDTVCTSDASVFLSCYHILGTVSGTYNPTGAKDGYIYVPRDLVDSYKVATNWSTYASQFRALEDYTVDGTTTGELDPNKI